MLGFDNFLEWLTEPREILTFTILLLNLRKDTNQHSDRRDTYIYGVGHNSSSTSTCSATWKLSEPCAFGIFMEAASHKHDLSLNQIPVPFPFLVDRRLNVVSF